jgi:hypothetical protein
MLKFNSTRSSQEYFSYMLFIKEHLVEPSVAEVRFFMMKLSYLLSSSQLDGAPLVSTPAT